MFVCIYTVVMCDFMQYFSKLSQLVTECFYPWTHQLNEDLDSRYLCAVVPALLDKGAEY